MSELRFEPKCQASELTCLFTVLLHPPHSPTSMCVLSRFSRVWVFETLWTVAHQAPLSMRYFRQEYWSGLPCPPPGDLSNAGRKPMSLESPALGNGFFTTSTTWEANNHHQQDQGYVILNHSPKDKPKTALHKLQGKWPFASMWSRSDLEICEHRLRKFLTNSQACKYVGGKTRSLGEMHGPWWNDLSLETEYDSISEGTRG